MTSQLCNKLGTHIFSPLSHIVYPTWWRMFIWYLRILFYLRIWKTWHQMNGTKLGNLVTWESIQIERRDSYVNYSNNVNKVCVYKPLLHCWYPFWVGNFQNKQILRTDAIRSITYRLRPFVWGRLDKEMLAHSTFFSIRDLTSFSVKKAENQIALLWFLACYNVALNIGF